MAALAQLDVPTIVLLLLAAGAIGSVAVFGLRFLGGGRRSKRIDIALNTRRGELAKQQLEDLNRQNTLRQQNKKTMAERIHKIYASLNLQEFFSTDDLRLALAQAGMRGKQSVSVYITLRIVGIFGGFVVALLLVGIMWEEFPYPPPMRFVFGAAGSVAGFYLPKLLLTNAAQKRQQAMTEGFPDALDLMVICVEAGLSVENAFVRVTEEIMDNAPVLAQEIGLTSAELAYLGDRRQAFENFSNRTGLPAAKSLATTLIQTEQYGTPVGEALRVLADEKRGERMSIAEKKAAALPAKLTVPMIIFFLPILFLVVIGPAIIQITKM